MLIRLSLVLGLFGPGLLLAASLKLGTAAVDITPPPGTPMAGYYYDRAADGVHDPLYAKAMVLDDGARTLALVALDLISTTRDVVQDARAQIEKETGIPATHVMISATHAHTGPVLARGSKRNEKQGGQNPLSRQFTDRLPEQIAQAVKQAMAARQPALVFQGAGREENFGFNRRFFMRDGSVGWNPGKLNTNIVRPAGPTDPETPFVYFESPQREPLGIYANYAIHLDNVGGTRISADMPAVLARLMAEAKGSNFFTLYTTGCCGDINHINVQIARRQQGFGEAGRLGTLLAANILRTLDNGVEPITNQLVLRSKVAQVKLSLPPQRPEEVQWARELVAREKNADGSIRAKFMEVVRAYRILDVHARNGEPQLTEVQVFALGDSIAWVSLPGEIFVELGLTIKAGSPFRRTIIAELANGSIGYIPNRVAYPQGNYEVESARCAAGSGEQLVDSALQLLRELYLEAQARP